MLPVILPLRVSHADSRARPRRSPPSLSLSLFLFLEATATCFFNLYPLIYTLQPNEVRLVSLPTQELFGILFVPQHDATRATERVDLSYGQKPPLTYTVCSA